MDRAELRRLVETGYRLSFDPKDMLALLDSLDRLDWLLGKQS